MRWPTRIDARNTSGTRKSTLSGSICSRLTICGADVDEVADADLAQADARRRRRRSAHTSRAAPRRASPPPRRCAASSAPRRARARCRHCACAAPGRARSSPWRATARPASGRARRAGTEASSWTQELAFADLLALGEVDLRDAARELRPQDHGFVRAQRADREDLPLARADPHRRPPRPAWQSRRAAPAGAAGGLRRPRIRYQ